MDLEELLEGGVFDRYADSNDNLGRVVKTKKPDWPFGDNVDEEHGPWVVEWCCMGDQKNKMHICTLDDHIRRNFEALIGKVDPKFVAPWIILGVFRTHDHASEYTNPFYGITRNSDD